MRTFAASVLSIAFALLPIAAADPPDLSDRAFAEIVVSVLTIDTLKGRCSDGAVLRAASEWENKNGVDLIRARIDHLSANAAARSSLQSITGRITDGLDDAPGTACANLASALKLPDMAFARNHAGMLARLGSSATGVAGAATVSQQREQVAPDPRRAMDLVKRIDGFAFDYRMAPGVGGGLYMDVFPVVLFKNGQALTDIKGLGFAAGAEAHRAAYPAKWTAWKKSGGRIQTRGASGWKTLAYTTVYGALPPGFRLEGRYQHIGGAGATSYGGDDFVAAWSTYDFFADGRVIKGGGAGGTSRFQGSSTAFSSVSPDRRGRYRVDGLTLHIDYDDGSKETRIIVAGPEKRGAIWLDGTGYALKD